MEQFSPIKKSFLKTVLFLVFSATLLASDNHSPKTDIPPLSTPLAAITCVAFDTETTGFSPDADRIIEIGAVKFQGKKIIATRQWMINPGKKIPFYATKVHGITDKMVADKPTFEKIYPEFEEFTKGTVLIAHNSRFDRDFMQAELKRADIENPRLLLIDSLKLFRKLLPDSPSHSIGNLLEHLDMETNNLHRAVSDSAHIVEILNRVDEDREEKLRLEDLLRLNGGPDYL